MVEAVFGAVHVDSGFIAGQLSVSYVLKPILSAVASALASRSTDVVRDKARSMMHPKQFIHEMAGGIIQVKAWREESFALRQIQCPVWRKNHWSTGKKEGNGSIGLIDSFGIDIVGVAETSSHVARNRTCAIAMEIFMANSDLIDKLKVISTHLRSKGDGNQGV